MTRSHRGEPEAASVNRPRRIPVMWRYPVALAGLVCVGTAAFPFLTGPVRQSAGLEAVPAGAADLANGAALFQAGGCASCHAVPGLGDRTRLGGGLALQTTFGTFYPPNISGHPRDGIGAWTPAQFVRAMRAGVSPDGRHYFPAFPYTSYQRMDAGDLRDLFAYLLTLPQVEGKVRDHDLRFPFNLRPLVGAWKLLFLDGKPFAPDPGRDAAWNRGAYLVEGPGHCAECHSPRNALGAIIADRRFSGGPDAEGKGYVPNITPDKATGIGTWSRAEVGELLATGFTPDFDSVGSSMGEVVKNTANLSPADRDAMAAYIVSLPPRQGRKRQAK
jgi:mono/diheme cytochrome c family protein